MCRFLAYSGDPLGLDELIYKPAHSLVHQSYHANERREPLNGDGFGVGWYQPNTDARPAVYRTVGPAWSDQNMIHISPRVRTPLFFAHVRAASKGIPVHQLNCHPFSAGRLLFMHNGSLGGWRAGRRAFRAALPDEIEVTLQGSTDSEMLFAAARQELGDDQATHGAEALARSLEVALTRWETTRRNAGQHKAITFGNAVISDGASMAAIRYVSPESERPPASLYVHQAESFRCVDGAPVAQGHDDPRAVVVSSEPLYEGGERWSPVEPDQAVLVDGPGQVKLRPLEIPAVGSSTRSA